uniref:Uncharacterized protein n=1 Tax=Dechloromonas aromatica (strain RCB) TaxID=159087 RepID=Q47A91_DECAR
MNDTNPENPPENPPAVAVAPQVDTRRRLRELLSVPERDRTDEQWDEIIELEIQLAPGNRISGNESLGGGNQGRHNPSQHGKSGGGNAGGAAGAQQKKHRPRTNNNRRPRQNKPQSGGGGGNPAA